MTARYLLDTNIISAMVDQPGGKVARRAAALSDGSVATSVIVGGEIFFGIEKRRSTRLGLQVAEILEGIPILPIEPPVGETYGKLRATLEAKGVPIGANDTWIAAHALALNLTLVTDNESEFRRVDGLRVENWLRE